jgi:A/G-specific adenine glycosylase
VEIVNGLWKGLGYYSRATRLLSGAQTVVKKFHSHLPEDPAVLEKQIAGIGKYTAGAITSIAYGVCAPVVRLLHLISCSSIRRAWVTHLFSPAGWKC